MTHRALHPRRVRAQIHARPRPALLSRRDTHDLEGGGEFGAVELEQTELVAESGGLVGEDASEKESVKEDGEVVVAVDERRGGRDHSEALADRRELGNGDNVGGDGAGGGEVVEKTAGSAVGRVDAAEEAPGVGEELARLRGFHFGEELAAVDGAEVGEITPVVELLGDDGVACGLLEIETGGGDDVAGGEEIVGLLADVRLAVQRLLDPDRVVEIDLFVMAIDFARDGRSDADEELFQLLFEEHTHQMTA